MSGITYIYIHLLTLRQERNSELQRSVSNNTILYPSVYRCCCLCFSMAVVIRLQGLPITAGSEDIRKFFTGLKIPDGGVHIIGGVREEAFIIFASDEDARRAMTRSGGCIQGTPIALLLSSKSEMQTFLERSTRNVEVPPERRYEENARHGRRSVDPEVGKRPGMRMGYTPPQQQQKPADDMCVFLRGMPFSVTEGEVENFFSGLSIHEIILLRNARGQQNGSGFVQFATREDALEALKRDREYIGSRYIEVSSTTADDWYRATGKVPMAVDRDSHSDRDRSPLRNQRNQQHQDHGGSASPLGQRSVVPDDDEYCVLLENLAYTAEKEDIKNLFHNANLADDQILHLMGSDGKRTRSSFVLFKSLRDYCEALSNEKRLFLNRMVYTRPISREKMIALLESQNKNEMPGSSDRFQQRPPAYSTGAYETEKICVFAQNLPMDVRKVEIVDFFLGFNITEDKVTVLRDSRGAGIGKALIVFRSEVEAMSALSLNGRRVLGSEVMLKCISRSQMQQLGVERPKQQELLPREEPYPGRKSGYNVSDAQDQFQRNWDCNVSEKRSYDSQERGHGDFGTSRQRFDGPTCVQIANLPSQINDDEIYDFCYGYRIIPGSVSLQFDHKGRSRGSATALFESREEALTAIRELSGRPIGPRKIELMLL